jgi:ribonuclease Z
MPTLHLLGTGAAISDPHRTTTMLAFTDAAVERSTLVVDCGGDVCQRLLANGVSLESIRALVVTHAHMDHASGFPLFMEKIWLDGRERPIPVVGIEAALAQAQRSWDAFAPVHTEWDAPPIDWQSVPHTPDADLWSDDVWTVTASPVDHGSQPNVGLRVEHPATGLVVGYSCDTAPCDAVVDLAQDADVLVHEANGVGDGHSTAAEAATVAKAAGVGRLLLVHLPPGDKRDALRAARNVFPHTDLGDEGAAYPLQS